MIHKLTPVSVTPTSTVVNKPHTLSYLIYTSMVMTKAPGVQFLFCICTQCPHHEPIAHDVESQSVSNANIVGNQT
jgi:hypothetical protein